MGNTTSMREANAHKHGDVTCTMKHGRRRRHHTAKHKRSGHKRSGHKRSGHKRRRDSGGSLMNPIIPPVKKHRRSRRKYSGGVMMSPP